LLFCTNLYNLAGEYWRAGGILQIRSLGVSYYHIEQRATTAVLWQRLELAFVRLIAAYST